MAVETFPRNVERDAQLVLAAMIGGFRAACSLAMTLPGFEKGPDTLLAHADWLKRQDTRYVMEVSKRAAELEKEDVTP